MPRSLNSMETSRGSRDSSAAGEDRAPPQVHEVKVACLKLGEVQKDHQTSEQELQTLYTEVAAMFLSVRSSVSRESIRSGMNGCICVSMATQPQRMTALIVRFYGILLRLARSIRKIRS